MIPKDAMPINQFLELFDLQYCDSAEIIDYFDRETFDLLEDNEKTFYNDDWDSFIINEITECGGIMQIYGIRMKGKIIVE